MAKYKANMNVNNGTHLQKAMQDNNLKRLQSDISKIARGNCFIGNEYTWKVWNENGIIVAAGAGKKNGKGNFSHLNCKGLIGEHI